MSEKRRDARKLQEQLDELFSDLWQVPGFAGMRRGFRPHVDCYRSEAPHAITVVLELPGVQPSDVSVVIAEHQLVVSGVRRRPTSADRRSFQQMEIEYGPFERRIPLAEEIDADRSEATYVHGMLTIVLPVATRAPTGRVWIEVKRQ
jgi:HSP20 family protein